ncbi:MAG: glycoside hydrolase family 5 protein, partial [Anaerolineaceae bacterium]
MMKKKEKVITISVSGVILICVILYFVASHFGKFSIRLPIEHTSRFTDIKIEQFPSPVTVNENHILNADGQTIIFKGVMIPDPAVLNERDKFNLEFFKGIQAINANVIRVPVHPEEWIKDEDYLWRYLAPIVSWAGEMNMYVIIDWHFIGNIATGAGLQMPDIKPEPKELTMEFWQLMASFFQDSPNVIFEIFNEPQSIGALEWQANATEIVQAIRKQGAKQMIIVGGIDYGKDLSWVVENPIKAENIAYASHIYPSHSSYSYDDWFGTVAAKYPVLITEWGFMDENRKEGPSYLSGDEESYGKPFLKYLDDRDIGWVACWYDDEWLPPMF